METLELIKFYTGLMQDTITRLASNAAACKTWALTIVAAVIALTVGKNATGGILWVCIAILLIFWLLDAYYLSMERSYRDVLNRKLKELNASPQTVDIELLNISLPNDCRPKAADMARALLSYSAVGFYGLTVVLLALCIIFGWL